MFSGVLQVLRSGKNGKNGISGNRVRFKHDVDPTLLRRIPLTSYIRRKLNHMAKIIGGVHPPFIGTRNNLTIYLLKGEYVIRTKSSLTGKRVKRDPAFAKTMKYAGWLKQGARIASCIYRQLPVDERIYKQYRQLTGKAMLLLKEGFAVDDVITMLEAVYLPQPVKNAAGIGTEGCRKYGSEYTCEYNGGNNSVNSNVNSNVNSPVNSHVNSRGCSSEYGGGYRYKYAHEYMLPYYSWGDRPQRAVQVGTTGLSSLKYADATHQGFNIYSKARYAPLKPNGKELQRSTASGPILQP
jgi:hypothetical protein